MRRTDAAPGEGDMARRAARWHAPRPSDEGLRELAELMVRAARDEALLARVVHQLAAWCRHATPATATHNMVRDHEARMARGDHRLRPLAGKALDFHRGWSHRAPWAWLACR
jgi:hypothetical protein